jgi:hypothetical protein
MGVPLEFLFKLDAKLDGALKMLGVLDKSSKALHALDQSTSKTTQATEKLDRASSRATATHAKHAQGALNLGKAFDTAKSQAHGLLEAMGLMLVFEGVEKLVDKFKELGSEIIHTAATAQRSDSALKLTLGENSGTKVIEWIDKIKNLTEFTSTELLGFSQNLARVGMKTDDIFKAIIASMDIAGRSKSGIEGMSAAVEAFGRMERTGKMNNLALGGLGFGEKDFRQLDRFKGMGKDQFRKQFEEGGLSQGEVFQLLQKTTGKPIGDIGLKLGEGMSATLTHLGAAKEGLFEKLKDSPAFEKLNVMLKDLVERLDPKSPLGSKLLENMEKALTKFVDVMAKIDMEKFSASLIKLFEKLPGLIEQTTAALVGLGKAMGRFAGVAGPDAVGPGGHAIVPSAPKTLDDTSARFIGTSKSLEMTPDQQKGVAKLQNWAHKYFHIGNGATESFAKGLLEGVPKVKAAVGTVGDESADGLKTNIKAYSPSKVFEGIGTMAGEGYWQGLRKSLDGETDSVPSGAFAMPVPTGGVASRTPIVVNLAAGAVSVVTNLGGNGAADGEQLGQAVAQHVESILPSALESAFSRIRQETGS